MNEVNLPPPDRAAGGEPAEGVLPDEILLLDEVALPMWEATGEPAVDAALAPLSDLDPDDLTAHAAVFERVHQELRQVLADLDR